MVGPKELHLLSGGDVESLHGSVFACEIESQINDQVILCSYPHSLVDNEICPPPFFRHSV